MLALLMARVSHLDAVSRYASRKTLTPREMCTEWSVECGDKENISKVMLVADFILSFISYCPYLLLEERPHRLRC